MQRRSIVQNTTKLLWNTKKPFYDILKKMLWNAKKLCHKEAIVDIKMLLIGIPRNS